MLQCVTFAKINKTNGYLRFSYMTMKRILPSGLMIAASVTCMAQSLEKMQWFNEPEQWGIENDTLSMEVTPQTDYWRISHYGFTVDDAPFLYTLRGGEFEVKVKISGDYKTRFDQSGLMLRIDQENYIKAGICRREIQSQHCSDPSYERLEYNPIGKPRSVRMDKGGTPIGCGRGFLFF